MNTTSSSNGRRGTPRRGLSIRVLALTAIALCAMTTGCIQDHDPRNDSSRLDAHQSHAMSGGAQRAG